MKKMLTGIFIYRLFLARQEVGKIEIKNLSPDRIDEAVEVMLTAFKDEALTSSWLDLSEPKLKKAYSIALKIIYIIHLDSGDPIYVAAKDDTIVGVAGLKTPGAKKNKSKAAFLLFKNLPQLLKLLPSVLKAARALFNATKPPTNLPNDYSTLEVLAVDPGQQGKGTGRHLLDHIHQNHLDNNISGIYLLTGEDKNVKIYERFGYKVVEKRIAKGLEAYHMFKTKN